MQLSAFVILACALAAIARPIGGDGAKVVASIEQPVQSEVSDIGNDSGALGNAASLASGDAPARRARRRSLAQDIAPVMGAINPLAQGVDAGLQQGAGNVKAAMQNAGAALNQAAGDVGDIGADTLAGAGQTVGQVPTSVLQTIKALEYGGLTGSILGTAFGHRSNEASDNENDSSPLGAVSKPAGSDTPARRTRRRGMDAGLQQGAGNLKAAVQNAGATLDQAASE
ncbi:hypothetical protein HWV62_1695 [Athelia sp. TMB]|nr:hypothetical protein HWV62_1695 [Athelia sp. TMB]